MFFLEYICFLFFPKIIVFIKTIIIFPFFYIFSFFFKIYLFHSINFQTTVLIKKTSIKYLLHEFDFYYFYLNKIGQRFQYLFEYSPLIN